MPPTTAYTTLIVHVPVFDADALDELINRLDNLGERVEYEVLTHEDRLRQGLVDDLALHVFGPSYYADGCRCEWCLAHKD